MESMTLLDWIRVGGWVVTFLIFCSVVLWGVLIERAWTYYSVSQSMREFELEAANHILKRDLNDLKRWVKEGNLGPQARVLSAGIDKLSSPDQKTRLRFHDAMERARVELNLWLKRRLWILGTLASACPFVGLYGTVLGILKSFGQIAQTGAGGFATVASGISEALVATAGGILVAVMALVAYNTLNARLGALTARIKLQTQSLAELLEDVWGSP